jgi:hypothetical protein
VGSGQAVEAIVGLRPIDPAEDIPFRVEKSEMSFLASRAMAIGTQMGTKSSFHITVRVKFNPAVFADFLDIIGPTIASCGDFASLRAKSTTASLLPRFISFTASITLTFNRSTFRTLTGNMLPMPCPPLGRPMPPDRLVPHEPVEEFDFLGGDFRMIERDMVFSGNELQIRYVVVTRITISMMDVMTGRDRPFVELPNDPME